MLHQVRVGQNTSGQQTHLGEVFVVPHVDVLVPLEDDAHGQQQGDDHRTSREDGASNEVRREQRGVPSSCLGHREVPGNDGVYRQNQWGGEGGKEAVRSHAQGTAASLRENSNLLREAETNGAMTLVVSYFDLQTGKVTLI